MQIPILLEPVENNGYRATSGPPLALSAEGSTRAEAVDKLERQLRDRLYAGAEVVTAEVPAKPVENPWVKYAGMFKDDPMFESWQRAIADYRREIESDPNYL